MSLITYWCVYSELTDTLSCTAVHVLIPSVRCIKLDLLVKSATRFSEFPAFVLSTHGTYLSFCDQVSCVHRTMEGQPNFKEHQTCL